MMPVIFIGHGSPMNALEDNVFTQNWQKIAASFPHPKTVLAISAHWYTNGTRVSGEKHPKTIYDMYGFPKELYEIKYDALGAPQLAHDIQTILGPKLTIDNSWGFDHGAWAVLHKMYPKRDIRLTQLSVNAALAAREHFNIGRALAALRAEDVLIFASGNIVHNLGRIDWDNNGGYPWADDFDSIIKSAILKKDFDTVINYRELGQLAAFSVPTPDHYYPLLYALGAAGKNDKITVYNDARTLGSMSMTSYVIG